LKFAFTHASAIRASTRSRLREPSLIFVGRQKITAPVGRQPIEIREALQPVGPVAVHEVVAGIGRLQRKGMVGVIPANGPFASKGNSRRIGRCPKVLFCQRLSFRTVIKRVPR
jgi:hypothetical protein